jgi:hypothetical protein
MNGVRQSRRRWLVLAALTGALAIMAVGAGIALAVNRGTAGELNYRSVSEETPKAGSFSIRASCPSDRHVTGGGYQLGSLQQQVTGSRPFDGTDNGSIPDDGWLVNGENDSPQTISVYAICDD